MIRLHEISKIVNFIDTENGMVVARNRREGKWRLAVQQV